MGEVCITVYAKLVHLHCRHLSSEQSKQLDVEPSWSEFLWLLWLQPEAQEPIDPMKPIGSSNAGPFPGIEVGPVIGKGSFSHVCKGLLGGTLVAIKVMSLFIQ